MSITMDSIIFVTLSDGPYEDGWTSELIPLLVNNTRAGFRELTWEGQDNGLRDKYVKRDTLVAIRPNKKARYFDIVGTISELNRTRVWSEDAPAQYKLLVDMYINPRRIHRMEGERLTHNNVLRELGFALETGTVAKGIYMK